MKRLFSLVASLAMLVSFVACEDVAESSDTTPGFSGFASSALLQSVDSEGKVISFSFVADEAWSASVFYNTESGWVTISPAYGDPSVVIDMAVVVAENTDTEMREAKIQIVSGENQLEVTITQSGVGGSLDDDNVEEDVYLEELPIQPSEFMLTSITSYEIEDGEIDDDETVYIEYDDLNRVSQHIFDYGMVNCGDDGLYNYRKIVTYTYGDSTITEVIEYDYAPADAQDNKTFVYTLNSDGFIVSYEGESRSGTYTYSNGLLDTYTKISDYTVSESFELTWINGVLTSTSGSVTGDYRYDISTGTGSYDMESVSNTFTYGTVENLTNLDINVLIALSESAQNIFSDQSPLLAATGYMGEKTSNYLLVQDNGISGNYVCDYTYEFYDYGLPSQVVIMFGEDEDDLYGFKFTYTVK